MRRGVLTDEKSSDLRCIFHSRFTPLKSRGALLPLEVLFVLRRSIGIHTTGRNGRLGLRHRAHARIARRPGLARRRAAHRPCRGHKRQGLRLRHAHLRARMRGLQGGDIQFPVRAPLQRALFGGRHPALRRRCGKVHDRRQGHRGSGAVTPRRLREHARGGATGRAREVYAHRVRNRNRARARRLPRQRLRCRRA